MPPDFRCIVEDALGEKAPRSEEYAQGICEDRWIADYVDDTGWDYQPIPTERDHPAVLLILESPHQDEFMEQANGVFLQVGPAAGFGHGDTGYRILHFFCHRYLRLSPRYVPGMPIYLINAIQHQCSLNRKLKKEIRLQRDQVFIAAWNRGGMTNFKDRLRSYYRTGDIVVNACTGNMKQPDEANLKLIVEAGVIDTLNGLGGRQTVTRQWGASDRNIRTISDMGIHHPSSKWFERAAPIWTIP